MLIQNYIYIKNNSSLNKKMPAFNILWILLIIKLSYYILFLKQHKKVKNTLIIYFLFNIKIKINYLLFYIYIYKVL